jgi:HD-like signal output (HDOD) protein
MGEPALRFTLEEIHKSIDELPSLPTVVYELTRIINDPMSSTKEVEELMATDMGLTTRVLKLANSAYYAIPGGVSNLSRAIAYIGFDTINQLVLSSSIIDALAFKEPSDFNLNEFWRHSIGVGIAAETIGKIVHHPNPPDLFTAGLIHDMGKVALCAHDMKFVAHIADWAKKTKVSFLEAESRLELPKHTDVGMLLAEKWKLPVALAVGVRFHHTADPKLRTGLSPELQNNVDIVFLANLLNHALHFGNSGHGHIAGVPNEVMGRMGLTEKDAFLAVAKEVKKNLEKAQEFISTLLGATAGASPSGSPAGAAA